MLYEFLEKNENKILEMTKNKSLELAGNRATSEQLESGLPLFFKQLLEVLLLAKEESESIKLKEEKKLKYKSKILMEKAASESNEKSLVESSGRADEARLAVTAKAHGIELLRLGYTLSHVVHAYGSICQSITELANEENVPISANEFHDLNRCLDIAIAGAVTGFEGQRTTDESEREIKHLGFLAHELRNALSSVNISFQLIKRGVVASSGSTSELMEKGLKRIETLIDRSLTEVRMQVAPKVILEPISLLQLIDEILLTASVEAAKKNQLIDINISPEIIIGIDHQLFYSAISNLIQNAIKYTPARKKIQIRGKVVGEKIVIEVEDECGGLKTQNTEELFHPYVQQDENKSGLGLGLTIVHRAVKLNNGEIKATNLPGKGCIFTITMPKLYANHLVEEAEQFLH